MSLASMKTKVEKRLKNKLIFYRTLMEIPEDRGREELLKKIKNEAFEFKSFDFNLDCTQK